jgi:hypothetical protein
MVAQDGTIILDVLQKSNVVELEVCVKYICKVVTRHIPFFL